MALLSEGVVNVAALEVLTRSLVELMLVFEVG
jgi:hypothetical protein